MSLGLLCKRYFCRRYLKTLTGFVFVFSLLVIGLNFEFPKSTRSIIANISPLQFKEDFPYLRKLWSTAANALNENELYSEDFNVVGVLKALQKATILNVSMEHARTAFKWMFILEGGQRAVFKPRLYERFSDKTLCEKPEHELTAFILNRMFHMRNMPFMTGRLVNWYRDILPVATQEVKDKITEYRNDTGSGIIINWHCSGAKYPEKFYYPNGDIVGSLVFWYDKPIREFWLQDFRYRGSATQNKTSLAYKEQLRQYCTRLEKQPHHGSLKWFNHISDSGLIDFLMLLKNVKPAYIEDSQGNAFLHVMIDRGHAFRPRSSGTIYLIATIFECCRIVERTYNRLIDLKDNLIETFLEISKLDPLFPLLSYDQLKEMKTSFTTVLDLVNQCIQEHGTDAVMIKT